jgi:homoserine O-acetyltransferase/O-succinyltransferase
VNTKVFVNKKEFFPESGGALHELTICYTTYGQLNAKKDNVIWIVHALTGNSDPTEWWSGLAGSGKLFDTDKYFVICANNPGSCYGSTGPASINLQTGKKFGKDFPHITIRDIVRAHELLRKHLGIEKIFLLTGGSLGGQICLEWAIAKPKIFSNVIPIATNARHSAWGIAFNETQRMALESGKNGINTARAIAMLSYRCYETYLRTQKDGNDRTDNFSASSYQRYQGLKLKKRFDKDSYYILSKAMDSHNVARNRGNIERELKRIKARVLVIGIKSDILFPVREQKLIADGVSGAELKIIDSVYGHDGFLVENRKIANAIRKFLNK